MSRRGSCPCGHEKFGYRLEGGVRNKLVVGSTHRLVRPPAWAVQKEVYDHHAHEIKLLRFSDVETGVIYTVSRQKFEMLRLVLERGYGVQYALPLEHWREERPGVRQLEFAL